MVGERRFLARDASIPVLSHQKSPLDKHYPTHSIPLAPSHPSLSRSLLPILDGRYVSIVSEIGSDTGCIQCIWNLPVQKQYVLYLLYLEWSWIQSGCTVSVYPYLCISHLGRRSGDVGAERTSSSSIVRGARTARIQDTLCLKRKRTPPDRLHPVLRATQRGENRPRGQNTPRRYTGRVGAPDAAKRWAVGGAAAAPWRSTPRAGGRFNASRLKTAATP